MLFFAGLLLLQSCKTTKKCPDYPPEGSMGWIVNSPGDDFSPVYYDGQLYYVSFETLKSKSSSVFSSTVKAGSIIDQTLRNDLPTAKFQDVSTPVFYYDSTAQALEIYFSASTKNNNSRVKDIFYSRLINGKWEKPQLVPGINTIKNEVSPAISSDGRFLVFSSDRKGGYGGFDLYCSRRLDNRWTKPLNLGNPINTEENDISPFISKNGELFYASKGFRKNTGYDIIKAAPNEEGKWYNPQLLPEPYNSNDDDRDPSIFSNGLALASRREGGCGGYDLYVFPICGPIAVEVLPPPYDCAKEFHQFDLLTEKGEKIAKIIGKGDGFRIDVMPFNSYKIHYHNSCLEVPDDEMTFYAPCVDTSSVKIRIKFDKDSEPDEYIMETYKMPFFVNGYYQPATSENLNDLRMKFNYNIAGLRPDSRYIENPGERYDEYAPYVERALDESAEFILNHVRKFTKCHTHNQKLTIVVTGFADAKPLPADAVYDGESITDSVKQFSIQRGEQMTQELLARLRAYYTSRFLEERLTTSNFYNTFIDRIVWVVKNDDAVTESNTNNKRISIKIMK